MSTPRILRVGEEPPAMMPANGTAASKAGKAKGKAVTGERFAMLNAFVDFSLAGLTRGEIAVWFVLYRDTRNGTARTSYDDLARRVGMNRRNVGRAVHRLKARGLLCLVYQGGFRRGASRYAVRALAQRKPPADDSQQGD